jgi:Zn finger protein HypA/HybF involved in hydrogenase expression
MIRLQLSSMIVVVMLIGVVLVVALWTWTLWQERRREVRRRRIAVQCRICSCTYVPLERATLSTCPSCGSRNQRGALRPI